MLGDKLSPGTKQGFLKSEKMLRFKLLYIHKSVLENVCVNNISNNISHIQYNQNKWQQHLPQLMAITPAIEQIEPKWATTSALVA